MSAYPSAVGINSRSLTNKNFRPLTSRLRARLSGRTITDSAIETRILAPGFEIENPPTIALPDERDRIVGHHPLSIPAENFARLDDLKIQQGPTQAYFLRDVMIADGSLMTRGECRTIRSQKRRPLVPRHMPEIHEAGFCSYYVTERYFGHWLTDGLTTEMLAKDHGWAPLTLAGTRYYHAPGYRAASGLHTPSAALARVDRFWLLEDSELNADRIGRLHRLRNAIRRGHGRGTRRVYLSRGELGVGRHMLNERQVEEALEARGFDILCPERMSAAAIVDCLRRARMVVAQEGSALAHAIVAAPARAGMLLIQAPTQFNMIFKTYAAAIGMVLGYTVGDPISQEAFMQPIKRLHRAIDLLDSHLA